MKCLHICNDFLGSKVYTKLYEKLDESRVVQHVFCPLREQNKDYIKKIHFQMPGSRIHYSQILGKYHRLFFRSKIKFLYKDLNRAIDLQDIDIIHTTTLYSDGGLALKIFKNYGIPYIVTVRSTDIGAFNTYRPDLFFFGLKILRNASRIIFISNVYKVNFYRHYFYRNFRKKLLDKSEVIPNGINRYWIDHTIGQKKVSPSKIIYVGTLLERKNVLRLIEAVLLLKKDFPKIELSIVGENGAQQNEIERLAKENPDTIKFRGAIYEMENLLTAYRSHHIFAMPSMYETFGLVYVEALSQGLPILYTKNEGIDGTFEPNIGEAVNPKSLDSIREGLERIIRGYSSFQLNRIDFSQFSWKRISQTYLDIYRSMRKS